MLVIHFPFLYHDTKRVRLLQLKAAYSELVLPVINLNTTSLQCVDTRSGNGGENLPIEYTE